MPEVPPPRASALPPAGPRAAPPQPDAPRERKVRPGATGREPAKGHPELRAPPTPGPTPPPERDLTPPVPAHDTPQSAEPENQSAGRGLNKVSVSSRPGTGPGRPPPTHPVAGRETNRQIPPGRIGRTPPAETTRRKEEKGGPPSTMRSDRLDHEGLTIEPGDCVLVRNWLGQALERAGDLPQPVSLHLAGALVLDHVIQAALDHGVRHAAGDSPSDPGTSSPGSSPATSCSWARRSSTLIASRTEEAQAGGAPVESRRGVCVAGAGGPRHRVATARPVSRPVQPARPHSLVIPATSPIDGATRWVRIRLTSATQLSAAAPPSRRTAG